MASSGPPTKKVKELVDSSIYGGLDFDEGRGYDAETQKALEEIDAYQKDIYALNVEESEEILKVAQKYNKSKKLFFENRNTIIKKIPDFWVTVFINHPQLSEVLEKKEIVCLYYLKKLEVEEFEDIKSGYRINFHFDENPFFENSVITKEFCLGSSANPVSQSTTIQWKDGQDLTKKTKEESAVKGGMKKGIEQKTFFSWFSDHRYPMSDDVAEVIKDDMWQNPLRYYFVDNKVTNVIEGDESDEVVVVVKEDEEEDDDEEEEDDEEEGDDEEEEDDEEGAMVEEPK